MTRRAVLSLTLVLFAWGAAEAENLVSGPQAGEKVPGRFNVTVLSGDHAGKTRCPVDLPGHDLTAMIFVRDASDPVLGLVRKIDARLEGANRAKLQRGVFVVITNSDPAVKRLLVAEKLKHVVLCSGPDKGIGRYELAEEADQTAVVFANGTVKANHAFRKGELDAGWTKVILEALPIKAK